MRIDSEYNNYFVYTALFLSGTQISCGACPVLWEGGPVSDKKKLTWADGNYHLYDADILTEADVEATETAICSALDTATTFGVIELRDAGSEVRWCLLESGQVGVVMDFPNMLQAA